MVSNYEYEIDQCDVVDKGSLRSLRQKKDVWLSWLSHEESSSIENQLYNLMWWDATYWTLNEARKFSNVENPSSAITPILAGLLDQGYLALQILSISKLVEKNSSDPRKGVISLRRLVDEMRQNANLFTRENYVAYDGLPFDFNAVYQQYLRDMSGKPPQTIMLAIGGPTDWSKSQHLHETFDQLSGKKLEQRSRTDLISEQVWDSLASVFENNSIRHILDLRHKLFAHAADEYSRSCVTTQIDQVELDHIVSAQKILSQLMQTISVDILSGPCFRSLIAIPAFNQFNYISLPYVQPENRRKLNEYWEKHFRECGEWLPDSHKVILKGIF